MNNVSGLYKCQYPGRDTILVLQHWGNPSQEYKEFLCIIYTAAHESTIMSIKISI